MMRNLMIFGGIFCLMLFLVETVSGQNTDYRIDNNSQGSNNAFFGINTGALNTTGRKNTFLGISSGRSNTTACFNTFVGFNAGRYNSTGERNTFFGSSAGVNNISGGANSIFGTSAGSSNTTGNGNAFFGRNSGYANISGGYNAFFGGYAGSSNTTGSNNTFIGRSSGRNNTSGQRNTYIGHSAGINNKIGNDNVFLGYTAGDGEAGSNKLYIANDVHKNLIYGDFANDQVGINTKNLEGDNALTVRGGGIYTEGQLDADSSRFIVREGKVGIGTTNLEDFTLAVGGDLGSDGNATINGEIIADSSRFIVREGKVGIGTTNLEDFTLAVGGDLGSDGNATINGEIIADSSRFIVRDGKVGIGTSNPEYTLDVNGITASNQFLGQEVRVKLKNDWPDYVFYPDYELPSLAQEAQHIEEKGHLSGFQSAEEMNGEIQLGDVTKRQQVKIEELMLHMIAMKKEIEALKAELKATKG